MVQSATGLLLGILLFQQLPALPPTWVAAVLLPLAVLAFQRFSWVAAAGLGFAWAWQHAAGILDARLPDELAGRKIVVSGWIHGLPEQRGDGQRFLLDVERVETADGGAAVPRWKGRVRLTWRGMPEPVGAGERWRLTARLYAPNGFRNPGGYDYERRLYLDGLGGTGYVLDAPGNRREPGSRVRSLHHRVREVIRARVEAAGGVSAATALFNALTIGDRSGFSDLHWEVFRATGTSHLVAISGLHLGLVAGLMFWLTDRMWRRRARLCLLMPAGYAGGLAALAAAAVYALLSGFALPAQRALVMLAAGLGALSLRRVVTPRGVLALAVVAVVLFDPNAVLSGGFWLSFAAVAVIYIGMNGRHAGGPLSAWWRVQWSLALGLLPVLAAWGLPVAAIAPLVNLVAVPWFTLVIVPLSFLTLLLLMSSWGAGLLQLDLWLLEQTLGALQYVAEASAWRWTSTAPGLLAVSLAGTGVLVLLLPLPTRYRAMGLVMLLPLVFRSGEDVPSGSLRMAMLDVGQGLSIVVRTANHTLVYDLGPRFPTGFNAAESVVMPFLAAEGVDRVDRLVLSHDDADHAGAWQAFVAQTRVDDLVAGQPERLTEATRPCRRGDSWIWDGVRFEILHPTARGASRHDNDASCVLRVSHPRASFLLTGDITRAAERGLAQSGVEADFVVVPHHGSRSSSSRELVRASGARFALVSAGYRNRYGFPDPVVVDRWRSVGARIINTADAGAVIIDVDAAGEREITRFRDAARRYWHR